jgi:regulator of replication initiation timing
MEQREQNLKMAVKMERLTEQLERIIARNMELAAENEKLRKELEVIKNGSENKGTTGNRIPQRFGKDIVTTTI